jgi:hypothetical protein
MQSVSNSRYSVHEEPKDNNEASEHGNHFVHTPLNDMPATTTRGLNVKQHGNNNVVHNFPLPKDFQSLEILIKSHFNLPDTVTSENIEISYIDNSGDSIKIMDDDDITCMIEFLNNLSEKEKSSFALQFLLVQQ